MLPLYKGACKFTFRCVSRNVFTWIDNIYIPYNWTTTGNSIISDVIDSSDNHSDHLAFNCNWNCAENSVGDLMRNSQCMGFYKYIWSDFAKVTYYADSGNILQDCINKFKESHAFICTNRYCADSDHRQDIDRFYENITDSLSNCSKQYFKHVKPKSFTWSAELSELKQQSKISLIDWCNAGYPTTDPIKEKYVFSKKRYKKAIKIHKSLGKQITLNELEEALSARNNGSFWKIFNNSVKHKPTLTDLKPNDFVKQFKDNFISSSDNDKALNEFFSLYSEPDLNVPDFFIDVCDVECAVKNINASECLDYKNLTYGHIILAHPAIMIALSLLFNAIIKHGKAPGGFGSSILLPTVKDKNKDKNDVSNYRPISILPLLAKIFERCLEKYLEPFFAFHPNQYGFVKNGGCNRALFTFSSTVDYFVNNGSNVYICSLDASKAFDRVNHFALFAAMLRRGVPKALVNIFLSWYSKLSCQVRWDGAMSNMFAIHSGLPQGSLLSPKLYNIIMDHILIALEESGVGCYVNLAFVGAIAYADDLVLLSASLVDLQKLLHICSDVALIFDIIFNVSKSVAGFVGIKLSNLVCSLDIQGRQLSWVDIIKYLGIEFKLGTHLQADLSSRVRKFQSAVCAVLRHKLTGHELVYVEIILKKCMPILFYGLGAFDINSYTRNTLSQVWNMAFRFVFGLNKHDSTRHALQCCNTMSIKFLFDERLLVFFHNLSQCESDLLHNLWCYMFRSKRYCKLFTQYCLCGLETKRCLRMCLKTAFNNYCDNL